MTQGSTWSLSGNSRWWSLWQLSTSELTGLRYLNHPRTQYLTCMRACGKPPEPMACSKRKASLYSKITSWNVLLIKIDKYLEGSTVCHEQPPSVTASESHSKHLLCEKSLLSDSWSKYPRWIFLECSYEHSYPDTGDVKSVEEPHVSDLPIGEPN